MQDIKITILGSGTMVPTKYRNPAGFLLEVENQKILLDCGHGIVRRLVDKGYDIQDIDLVFISHFHTDHFGDAFNLIHSRWVDDTYKVQTNKGLQVWGPKGIKNRFSLWRKIYWVEPKEKYPVYFKEGIGKLHLGKISIMSFEVKHVPWFQSIGAIIKYQSKKVVYTGDIGSKHNFGNLVKTVKGADLLITEASYYKPTPNHYTIEQVKNLKKAANVGKVLVVHIRPQHENEVKKALEKERGFLIKQDNSVIVV